MLLTIKLCTYVKQIFLNRTVYQNRFVTEILWKVGMPQNPYKQTSSFENDGFGITWPTEVKVLLKTKKPNLLKR